MRRRSTVLWAGIACACASVAFGQAEPSPDQLRRMYSDTLHQLQEAQDRKNELAAENDKLNARVADLQKQLDAAQTRVDESARQSAEFARRTFDQRAELSAWQGFLAHDPATLTRWNRFLRDATQAGASDGLADELDANWPWSAGR